MLPRDSSSGLPDGEGLESDSPLNLEWAGSGNDAIDAQVVQNRFAVVFGLTPPGTYKRTVKMFRKIYKAGENTLTLKCD